ncbi:PREDICTED: uncharacterized protein LOC109326427 [Lupinus angustifolius]|uniref:uncharacterized protein LOC109326427 n=1 Tax=Lupinus angustifolius TaxID=3871 RepID=UPI00092EAE45|nr:PREDICTED: uncharacterized protein LOC109326427 [Lupinus angustifolius]
MSGRTLVPIFFVWALLTIITPTLIFLSENSKADLDLNGNYTSEGMKARKMFVYTQNDDIIRTMPQAKSVESEEEVASASAPAPTPSLLETSERVHSLHNHTLISNITDYGLTLSLVF